MAFFHFEHPARLQNLLLEPSLKMALVVSSSAARSFRAVAVIAFHHLAPPPSTIHRHDQSQNLLSPLQSVHQPALPFYRRALHVKQGEMSQMETSSKDIIERIKTDHRELDDYYSKYKAAVKARDEDDALKWFNQFVWEICRHAVSEELVLYPMLERLGENGKNLAGKSRADHRKVKVMLSEMEKISDPFAMEAKMDLMMKDLREHNHMEENEDLKLVQEKLSLSERETAGATFSLGKKIAPTRPHTAVPEKQVIIEAALGLLATPVDKLRDMFTSFPSREEVSKS